jgi:pyruvate,orthophosphate dikinase
MMDTVLNVGLTTTTVEALAQETQNLAFAWACYERLAESYARIVRQVGDDVIEEQLLSVRNVSGEARSRQIVAAMNTLMRERTGSPMPDSPRQQIVEAVDAVFGSWMSPRAKAYRKFRGIDGSLGTAAVVQTMVFGNRGETSGSGVAFTRDPSTGEPCAFGDFLFNAQGEDVVAGTHDPAPLQQLGERLPATFEELVNALDIVEVSARDMSEVEFTVDNGSLWILQTRVAQRSGPAAVRIAVSLVEDGKIDAAEAILRVTPAQVEAAASPTFAHEPPEHQVLFDGVAASPGAVVGKLVFDVTRAVELAGAGEDVILVRPTTSPGDVAGFIAARGVVTGRGGRTSHAAVVARGMGRPAVCGVGSIILAPDGRSATIAGDVVPEGKTVSLDGTRGVVASGALPMAERVLTGPLRTLLAWCEAEVRIPVLPSVDSAPPDEPGRVLVLDAPGELDAKRANRVLAEANLAGAAPTVYVSDRWAAAADRVLEGQAAGICCIGRVVSWPVLARSLRSTDASP